MRVDARIRLVVLGLVFAAMVLPSAGQKSAAGTNILVNASFEDVENGLPKGWRQVNYGRRAAFAVDENVFHSGSRSLRISSTDGADAYLQVDVAVRPFASYRLSGWVKTEDVKPGTGRGALFNIHGMDVLTPAVSGTQDWTRVEIVFETGANDGVSVNCLFGGWGRATGTAWFDDLSLEQLSARTVRPRAQIDAAAVLPPISKYIYGQFIEHLGRCIYQGIWAEMLEDRKFFYPVGAKESPWKAVGDPRNVRMNPILPYVGVHAPEIRLTGDGIPGGIVQENLAVVSGREYVGRIVLSADPGALPLRVSLIWGTNPADRQTVEAASLGPDYRTVPLAFKAQATTDEARLEIQSGGRESFRIGTVSLMPADNVEGFRPEVLAVLKELNAPVYRWPGGNFVSGYDWRDGLGDPDKRPPRKNPAWTGVEHNDVGIHEFMRFCEILGTEPYIAVNSGQGSETQAAEEVEYLNGPESSPMGRLRAKNGRSAPWKVVFWSVGNEMYGNWQLGHMPLSDYVKKHNRFAQAMRGKDPSIELIAVGAVGSWSEGMLAGSAEFMDSMSEHFYVQSRPGVMSHAGLAAREVKRIADAHRRYRETIPAVKGREIPVALDEWNYWYGPHVYGELGTQYFLKDALGIAAGLHEFFRNTDVFFMANYAQTVNVIGAVKTNKTAAVLDTTGEVLALYRNHFGTIPLKVGGVPAPLDVAAAWKDGKKILTVAVVNPSTESMRLSLSVKGLRLASKAKLFRITGPDPLSKNMPGLPPEVKTVETAGVPFGGTLTLPPMSVSLYEIPVR
ncbi:MAG: carbohydrate binding domain-containing protein [Candidatus Aminicenantes bacterium]|nr:carbohydrate binding domain-containing protein [Candidatus Aminicenantes bacterium]